VVDHHEDDLYLTDNRAGKKIAAETYLVSGGLNYSPDVALPNDDGVLVLDTGDAASSVRVPLVGVGKSRYAYWVSDNSVKALYNTANAYNNTGSSNPSASNEEFYSSAIAQSAQLDGIEINGSKPLALHSSLDQEELKKGITLETLRLLFPSLSDPDLKKSFHYISSDSASVFSDPMHGGLKRDLTPFIEMGDMRPRGADQNKNLEDLLTSTPIIKGEHHNMTSPRFGILKNWADMWFKMSSASGKVTIAPQVSPDSFRQNFSRSLPLKRRDLTKVSVRCSVLIWLNPEGRY